ncbi:hypothetical protein N7495_009691 [Penicillium taxi]|uniref:uncharacterized protein n=1 Tax=Penicillium taxi TaxID=168475 RepID=UPI00254544E5|nr:uncharacterized protein N7495_009691 [Penicillium taxi]KAJ5885181.1 hypothetical protein N7495_009691 [Penicillium taxi]
MSSVLFDDNNDADSLTYEEKKEIEILMSTLFHMGVPIVMAAGNIDFGDESDEVNGIPQVFEDDDFPLLNVGSADQFGNIDCTSKRGSKVSVYLDGTAATCVAFKDSAGNYVPQIGTSYAAPLLAGMIAVFMSQTQGKFYDATHQYAGTREFVERVRHFIKTEASYIRVGGARMGWNMAPKAS